MIFYALSHSYNYFITFKKRLYFFWNLSNSLWRYCKNYYITIFYSFFKITIGSNFFWYGNSLKILCIFSFYINIINCAFTMAPYRTFCPFLKLYKTMRINIILFILIVSINFFLFTKNPFVIKDIKLLLIFFSLPKYSFYSSTFKIKTFP